MHDCRLSPDVDEKENVYTKLYLGDILIFGGTL